MLHIEYKLLLGPITRNGCLIPVSNNFPVACLQEHVDIFIQIPE